MDDREKSKKKTKKETKDYMQALSGDSLIRFDGIPQATWDEKAAQSIEEGGKGSGDWAHLGRPGAVGGSTSAKVQQGIDPQVWQRARKRPGFNTVRNAITYLRTNSVMPDSGKINWHLPIKGGGNLIGAGVAITTIASKPATDSTAIKVAK